MQQDVLTLLPYSVGSKEWAVGCVVNLRLSGDNTGHWCRRINVVGWQLIDSLTAADGADGVCCGV